jgi:molecular chaperone DnaJ
MSAQPASVDFYAALDIPRNATTQEINAAYKRLALKYHPDKCGERFLEKFREVCHSSSKSDTC